MAQSGKLQGKITFVSGASRGIGAAIARLFAAEGAILILHAKTAESLTPIAEELTAIGAEVHLLPFDVSNNEAIKAATKELIHWGLAPDVLVNNAGIMKDTMLGLIQPALVQEVYQTNAFGTIYLTQALARFMMKKKQGSIINLSSAIGTKGFAGQVVYGGSKAAIAGITLSSAKELAAYNIRVNAIAPGFIATELTASLSETKRQQTIDTIKLKRPGLPEEVAQLALFLASDQSAYITGQVIGIDGGMCI